MTPTVGKESSMANTLVIVACFAAVYIIWGSTYLAIRFAIESIPPWLMAASRFGAAGLIMIPLSYLRREKPLSRREKIYAAQTGFFLLSATSTVCFVEKWIPSGTVAVIVGAMPIWVMLLGKFIFKRERISILKYLGANHWPLAGS